jgi:hypothetical protein
MLPKVDFNNAAAVSEFVREKFVSLHGKASDRLLARLFDDVDSMFAGRTPDYSAIDLKYHNLRHTLMATACMTLLLEGQHLEGGERRLTPRYFELAIASVLLHDSGYLKLRSDPEGTGAKYTFCHILRSGAFAASYLPKLGVTEVEIENVLSAINCTGPNSEISRLRFRDPVSRMVGCDLATADYLAQLADPLYPDKLGELYAEFEESDSFANVPEADRVFKSEEDLLLRTPGFWLHFVKPKLENDFQAVYRYLERPLKSGRNAYMDAVEANFARIQERIAAAKAG